MNNRRQFIKNLGLLTLGLITSSFRKIENLFATSKTQEFNIILGRATTNSIALNIIPSQSGNTLIRYGTERNNLNFKSPVFNSTKGQPDEIELTGLKGYSRYYYQVELPGQQVSKSINSFQLNRKFTDGFVFTVTADSHLGTQKHCNPEQYRQTLKNCVNDNPDFHISLGDDFRSSKVKEPSLESISKLYKNQRDFLGELCHSSPFYFALGNHELESKGFYDGTEDCIASWSYKARKTFLPIPESVNNNRQNYYSFVWGNSLFIILDVYWYSGGIADDDKRIQDNEWSFSIGKEQYDWFNKTLENSKEKYKFVFGHHVLGSCRGGVEWADKYEWGGKSRNGNYEFDKKRPGWGLPIHQVMVKFGVNAFFQGHDHIFVNNVKDSVSYITCPMPGDEFSNPYNIEAYLSGDKIENSGHLKVTVSNDDVQLEYIKSVQIGRETEYLKNGQSIYKYSLLTKRKLTN